MIYLLIQTIVIAFISLLVAVFCFALACYAVAMEMKAKKNLKLALKLAEMKEGAKDAIFSYLLKEKDDDIERFSAKVQELSARKLKVKSKR